MSGAEPVEVRPVLAAQVEDVLEAPVATSAVRAPRRSSSALVAIVVPWVKRSTSAPTAAAAASTDSSWFRAVGTFAVRSSPSLEQDGVGERAAHVDAQDGHGAEMLPGAE